MPRLRRLAPIALAALVLLPPGVAAADAPGPTDYRSSVVSVDPPTPTIHARVLGGDSFLELRVDAGTEVAVSGYQGEPYLHFAADGSVFENRTSPTYALSRSRYGGALPDGFDTTAAPEWHQVSSDGSFAWHDHRIHWMTDIRPPGKRPGEVILRSRLPMTVDGVEIEVTVESVWIAAPSRVPVWLGAAVGLVAALVVVGARRWRWAGLPVVDVALLATVVGWWQYHSFPSSTGPQVVWFALPLAAAVAAIAAVAVRAPLTRAALTTLAGVNLVIWAWQRRDGITMAVLPTNAPAWLDRFAAAAALAAGPIIAAAGLAALAVVVIAPQRLDDQLS